MRRLLPLLLLLILIPGLDISAQQIKVKITNTSNEPVPYATLYIREIALGLVADHAGDFQTTLENGEYTFDFSSLGYERKTIKVTIDKPVTEMAVIMETKAYTLKEVRVSAKREDPAYTIMRKAISMAPYYLNQIKSYESDIYVKGTMKVDKIPRYIKVLAKDTGLNTYEKKLFLMESQNEVTFTAPNTYDQKVIAFTSSIPADIDASGAMDVLTANIYDPNAFGRISPLAPGAFSYYKFTLEGMSTEGDLMINKIRVEPKKKNPKLVTGWLYIIENSWNVKSADLSATEMGVTIRFTGTFNEVKPLAFLPTSYDIDLTINVMGVKAQGKYYSSIQYKNVELNEEKASVQKINNQVIPEIKEDKPKTAKQQKAQEQLEKLAAKEEISTREAYKMAKLMEKTVEPDEVREKKESLEIIPLSSKVRQTIDSMANYRDSTWWAQTRNLPLRSEEIISYQVKDSLKEVIGQHEKNQIEVKFKGAPDVINNLITGGSHTHKKSKTYISYGGLITSSPEYNFVDGFWLGQRIRFGKTFKHSRQLEFSPAVYYATARKSVNWTIDGTYEYNPFRNGFLKVSGGHTTIDINSTDGTMRILNSLSSLFFATNPISFYEKKFIEGNHRIDLINGLFLDTYLGFEKRSPLENNTRYSFFGGNPSPNQPEHLPLMTHHHTTKAAICLTYTPRYRYRLFKNRKTYHSSLYPTFTLRYETGIPSNQESTSYNRLEAGIKQDIKLNAFDNLMYYVNGGGFLNADRVYLPDLKHFATAAIFVSEKSVSDNFTIMDTYRYSTHKQWLQAHLNYQSGYLLFKRLPFLQSYLFDEGLHLKTLFVPGMNYSEAGYSIGIGDVGRIGVFTGWEKGKYHAVGFTLSLPVLLLF